MGANGVELATAYISLVVEGSKIAPSVNRQFKGVEVQADSTGKAAGKRMASGIGGSLKAGAKNMVAPVAAAFAGMGAVSFFKDAIGGASDLQEAGSKIAQIFGKDGAAAVQKFAAGGAKALGQNKNAVLAAVGTFGTFGKAAGLSGRDLAKFSTGFASLSTDIASFNNASPEEATEALGAALRGEAEPMRRFGVLLDDATLRNEALKLGLIKTTKDALTPQQKVLAAQAAIYKQTKDAQGDFARTSGGLANQQRILSASVVDLRTKMGQQLLPVATKVVGFFVRAVPRVAAFGKGLGGIISILAKGDFKGAAATFGLEEDSKAVDFLFRLRDGFLTVFGEIRGGLKAFAAAWKFNDGEITSSGFPGFMERLGYYARQTFGYIVGTVIPGMQNLAKYLANHTNVSKALLGVIVALVVVTKAHAAAMAVQAAGGLAAMIRGTKVITAVTKTYAAVQWLLNAALTANPIGIVIAALVALGVGLVVAYRKSETFRKIVQGAWQGIKLAASLVTRWFIGTALPTMRNVLQWIGDKARWLWTYFKTAWAGMRLAVSLVASYLSGTALPTIRSVFQRVGDKAMWLWRNVISPAFNGIRAVIGAQWRVVSGIFSRMRTGIGLVGAGFSKARDWVQRFTDKLSSFKLPGWVGDLSNAIGGISDKLQSGAGKIGGFLGGIGDGPGRPTGGHKGGNTLARVKGLLPGGTYVTSTYRTPAHNRSVGGSPSSYHTDRNNPAVDIGGSTAALHALHAKLRAIGGWRELLWQVPGHYDHVHVAHNGGPVLSSWPSAPGLRSDERPAILQVGERVQSRAELARGGAGGSGGSGRLHPLDIAALADAMSRRPTVLDGRRVSAGMEQHLVGGLR